ncbi:DUF6923 family protein [Sporohalobacter salinus]|uniref:DUF6923 family protein n=1 Tax=Sporohalobacter salinus TaxID=1494606 RepID=UPI00196189D4|nr:SdrD B-like domain-containing protein [Sporohalobacter salinus]MBM7625129.1 putative repeat protein (TIGR01451 family) [Sporohalobacter salinus]
MAATITGKVFDDVNHSGFFDPGEPGISNVSVVLETPGGTCITVQTDANGDYTFDNLTVAGTYTVYETVVDPGTTCPPTDFSQPAGFTNSTSIRVQDVEVTQDDIDNDVTIDGPNFGHDNANTFPCIGVGFQIAGTELFRQNLVTGEQELICDIGFEVNAFDYNEQDGYLYAIRNSDGNLIRIDADCNVTVIGSVPNLPNEAFFVGTIDDSGYFYVTNFGRDDYFTIDLTDPNSPTWGQLVDPTAGFTATTSSTTYTGLTSINSFDWVYNVNDGFIYALTSNAGQLRRLDPTTGQLIEIPTTGTDPNGDYGAAYSDADGNLYFINNQTGVTYRVTTDGVTAEGEVFTQAQSSFNNDGGSCGSAFIEIDFGDAPDTSAGNGPGDYTTLLENNGPRHQIINELFLGTTVTAEDDAFESPDALGDDQVQGIQDDAISVPLPNLFTDDTTYSLDATVTNETGEDANLYAWVDFNQDGIFQTNESITTTVPSQPGTQDITLDFVVPAGTTLTPGDTFVRTRLTTDDLVNTGGANQEDTRSIGPASDGEVEDYPLTILGVPELELTKSVDKQFADVGDTLNYEIVVENVGDGDALDIDFFDTIPNDTTFVPGSLLVNGSPTAGDLNTGIALPDLAPGESHIIEFQVTIDRIPDPNPIPNTATADFEDTQGEEFESESNTVFTQVNNAELVVEKSADDACAEVGEEITYTYTIENTGNVTATDVVLFDSLPEGTSFVAGSTVVNGLSSTDSPETGIDVPDILPGSTATVSFSVLVEEVPDANPTVNQGTVNFQYIVDPNEPAVADTSTSNEVEVEIGEVDLQLVKTVDKEEAVAGEELTYRTVISNNGTVTAQDVVFTDSIPTGTTFVEDSLTVDGVPQIGENPSDGVDIGDIDPGEFVTVEFKVTIDDPRAVEEIENQSNIDFQTQIDPACAINDQTAESNIVVTNVEVGELTVEKIVDQEAVEIGDTLTYTIIITNTGTVTAENVVFTDEIPEGTSFVEDSVEINGASSPGEDPTMGINLGNIDVGEQVVVTFEVLVESAPCPPELINEATVDFEINLETRSEPLSETATSNQVSTDVNLKVFKQLSIDEDLEIPSQKPDAEDVLDVTVNVEIISTEVIRTPDTESFGGQTLTGFKVIVEGVLKQAITYVADSSDQNVHAAHFEVPFSTFLVLPPDFDGCQKLNIIGEVEDVFIELIDERTIFKNVTLLLRSQDKCGCQ